jgi:hypothetical protein
MSSSFRTGSPASARVIVFLSTLDQQLLLDGLSEITDGYVKVMKAAEQTQHGQS